MKAYYLLAPLGLALLGGCTINPPAVAYTAPPTVAYTSPTYVTPGYVAPTVVAPSYRVVP